MNQNQNRWLQLAHVAVCAALADVACTDEALEVNEVTAAAVAEALRRSDTIKDAAAALDRSRGFIYDSLRRRQRDWVSTDWVAYGAAACSLGGRWPS